MSNLIRLFFAFCILAALLAAGAVSATADSKGVLIVKMTKFPSSNGFAMVAVFNTQEGYEIGETQAVATQMVKVENNKAEAVFKNLAYGWYGVSIYHDENANGKLDKNLVGVPKEAYAFSNNARGAFGKPGYEEVKFEIKSPQVQIDLFLK